MTKNKNRLSRLVLLKVHFILTIINSAWTLPITNTATGIRFDFLANVNENEEQIKLKLQENQKTKESTNEGLQVLDQLILDEAGSLLSSYSPGASIPEASPTTEDLVPGQANNGRVDLEEISPLSKDVDHLVGIGDAELMQVRQRLQKLDFYFEFLRVMSEDCRQRMLCEVMREPGRYYPLSSVLEDATSFTGSYQYLTSQLVNTTEGARLLSYLEASFRGQDRTRTCAVFQYRCPSRTEDMINYDALCLWREMVRWLTIHVIAKAH